MTADDTQIRKMAFGDSVILQPLSGVMFIETAVFYLPQAPQGRQISVSLLRSF
jgi:hypothetical protein